MSDLANLDWTAKQTWTARCAGGHSVQVNVYPFEGEWYAGTGPEGRILGATPHEAVWQFLKRYRMPIEEILGPGVESRVEILARLAAVEAERDAMLADLAPRSEPPSRAEVRALATLWGSDGGSWAIRCADVERGLTLVWLWEREAKGEAQGGWPGTSWDPASRCMLVGTSVLESYRTAVSWQPQGPDGPVAWSRLRALVEAAGG